MTADYPPPRQWGLDAAAPIPAVVEPLSEWPALLQTPPSPPADLPSWPAHRAAEASELTAEDYQVVEDLRDRVSTRLAAEDKNYAPGPRRELRACIETS